MLKAEVQRLGQCCDIALNRIAMGTSGANEEMHLGKSYADGVYLAAKSVILGREDCLCLDDDNMLMKDEIIANCYMKAQCLYSVNQSDEVGLRCEKRWQLNSGRCSGRFDTRHFRLFCRWWTRYCRLYKMMSTPAFSRKLFRSRKGAKPCQASKRLAYNRSLSYAPCRVPFYAYVRQLTPRTKCVCVCVWLVYQPLGESEREKEQRAAEEAARAATAAAAAAASAATAASAGSGGGGVDSRGAERIARQASAELKKVCRFNIRSCNEQHPVFQPSTRTYTIGSVSKDFSPSLFWCHNCWVAFEF